MFYFIANPRDANNSGNACGCCCEPIRLTPGEVNSLEINYAPWAMQMAYKGITRNTSFDLIKLSPDTPDGLLKTTPAEVTTGIGVTLTGDLISNATVGNGQTLKWYPLPLFGPFNGTFTLNEDGTYVYVPTGGFTGTDVIYYEVSDGYNRVTGTLAVAVGNVPAQLTHAPAPITVETNRRNYVPEREIMRVPISVGPDAVQGDEYRLTIRQEALDCDAGKYYHMSCYDIRIGKC